jgi:hypothetical protein
VDWNSYLRPTAEPVKAQVIPVASHELVWYFAYGANMSLKTISKYNIQLISRDAAFCESEKQLVFKHYGGTF